MNAEVLELVRGLTGAQRITQRIRIQPLWGGYGELARIGLEGGVAESVVVKWAKPPRRHPSRQSATGDARKRRSYEVEACFYRDYAPRCKAPSVSATLGDVCLVPKLLGQHLGEDEWIVVLEDLDAPSGSRPAYSRRERRPHGAELDACLAWLASFHATFLSVPPIGLWSVGTYWHLATRTEEYERMQDMGLREAAHSLDASLSKARFQTFVHGDAKPANFCFTSDGTRAAAVDFQYVGGGVGVKDVAYLLHGMDPSAEARALGNYFVLLRASLEAGAAGAVVAEAACVEWRALYPAAKEDFRRFLDGWQR